MQNFFLQNEMPNLNESSQGLHSVDVSCLPPSLCIRSSKTLPKYAINMLLIFNLY